MFFFQSDEVVKMLVNKINDNKNQTTQHGTSFPLLSIRGQKKEDNLKYTTERCCIIWSLNFDILSLIPMHPVVYDVVEIHFHDLAALWNLFSG